ncbi:interferon-induced GTP-binding protein Mx-like [Hypanus sabinus]|uniref:interferon-induced GTP-binding protein Mx-like n=1 Tax=Hypanus sabinus TaxID=79690 RepID=UPI0028C37F53|nr:interferon-induced GTP-binding protein Mx-like [Hypanus sabinus]XP_059824736.1 interferon-induced GTP-binding protein Mx-like [Hypanus sabinus]
MFPNFGSLKKLLYTEEESHEQDFQGTYRDSVLPSKDTHDNNLESDAVLYNQYEKRVRPCIDLIDKLRALGLEKDLSLPAIAVIGDQSSGKSSVLEALSGIALPRGSGMVTRCPLELKLKNTEVKNTWRAKISYSNYSKELSGPSEVGKEILKAQNTMAGADQGISSELIGLEVESDNVPDLTLIDLPGITRVAVGNQPRDIGDQIKQLIGSYIKEDKTINLVVIPCNVDIATTEALKMAQEVDPTGERTLGILTKPDLVDKGTEINILKLVNNEVVTLKKGYMVVKCRGQQDINDNLTLAKALENEKAFFKQNKVFRTLLDDNAATIQCVAARLSKELVMHIQRTLPTIQNEIQHKIADTNKELQRLGRRVPVDDDEKMSFLTDKIRDYIKDVVNVTSGECTGDYNDDDRLYSMARTAFGNWNKLLILEQAQTEKEMKTKVTEHFAKSRGRELPGFTNYKTFESLARNLILKMQPHSLTMLKEISAQVQGVLINMILWHFEGLPNLLRLVQKMTDDIQEEQEMEAEKMLNTLFKMESLIYTQDLIYCKKLKKVQDTYEESDEEEETSENVVKNTQMAGMSTHLKAYYKIALNRLADIVPMAINFHLLQEFADKLQRKMLLLLQHRNQIEMLLMEEAGIFEKRQFLSNRLKRLKKASEALTMH